MPICEIHFNAGTMSNPELDAIVAKLSPLLVIAEGLDDNPISRSICYINAIPSTNMFIGGVQSNSGKIVVKIYVFEEAYNSSIKENLFSDITKIFIEENHYSKEQNGNNIWCLIIPVKENDFGVSGIPATLEQTRSFVNSNK